MAFPKTSTEGGSINGRFELRARSLWLRFTVSRLTLLYLIFSIAHFILQVSFQTQAMLANYGAANFLQRVLVANNATARSLPIQRNSALSLCTWVSSNLETDVETCHVVWSEDSRPRFPEALPYPASVAQSQSLSTEPGGKATTLAPTATASESSSLSPDSTSPTATFVVTLLPVATGTAADDEDEDSDDEEDENNVVQTGAVTITTIRKRLTAEGTDGSPLELTDTCLQALNWPASQLHNTKREDIVFIAFQFWVLGMSIVALINESIPHILASLLTHVMATAWAAFQITQTANFRAAFIRMIANGACQGQTTLTSSFWTARSRAEIPALSLHVVAFGISAFFTWKLIKLFGWQTYKRVGASREIKRIYKIVLIMLITLQLSLFFMIVTVSLWIDQLFNSLIGDFADFAKLYKATSLVTLTLLIPWIVMGWTAVRRELRLPMFFFLLLSILYLAGWGVMFFSTTFRWTFVTWRFFSVMASASVLLTCLSFLLGVVCRFNFGEGLLDPFHPKNRLEDGRDGAFTWDEKRDVEKLAFPSMNSPLPTFIQAYGPANKLSESIFGYRGGAQTHTSAKGPRFFDSQSASFDSARTTIPSPPPAVTRNLTDIPQTRVTESDTNPDGHRPVKVDSGRPHRGQEHLRKGSQSSGHSGRSKERWELE